MKKLYVNSKQHVTVPCDHCGNAPTMKVPLRIRGNQPTKVRCQCGAAIRATFEFRQTQRKSTFFQGLLQRHVTDVVGQAAQIRDLSQGGLMLTTRWWRNLHKHDVLSITFVLDDPQRSKIHKRIIIKHIDGQILRTQFCPEDELSYQKELGFYLMGQRVSRETRVEQNDALPLQKVVSQHSHMALSDAEPVLQSLQPKVVYGYV